MGKPRRAVKPRLDFGSVFSVTLQLRHLPGIWTFSSRQVAGSDFRAKFSPEDHGLDRICPIQVARLAGKYDQEATA
jgi:hypothetical protein